MTLRFLSGRYEQRNNDIIKYFEDKDNFLLLYLDDNDNIKKINDFLKLNMNVKEFPKLNTNII